MKLELSEETVIEARAALKILQKFMEYNPGLTRDYERAYVEIVNAHTAALKEKYQGVAA